VPHSRSACSAGVARLWSVHSHGAEGTQLRSDCSFAVHAGAVNSLSLSSDGRRVASAGVDGTLRLWRVDSLRSDDRCLATFAHAAPVDHCAFDDDGVLLVACQSDGDVTAWDARDCAQHRPVACLRLPSPSASAAFAPGSRALLLTASSPSAQLWDLRMVRHAVAPSQTASEEAATWSGGEAPKSPPPHCIWASMLARSEGGEPESSAAAAERAAVVPAACLRTWTHANRDPSPVFHAASGAFVAPFTDHAVDVSLTDASFTPDGLFVVTSASDGSHRRWCAATGRGVCTFSAPAGAGKSHGSRQMMVACDATPAGLLVASCGIGRTALWSLGDPPAAGGPRAGMEAAPARCSWRDHATTVSSLACSTREGGLALASGDCAGFLSVRRAGDITATEEDWTD